MGWGLNGEGRVGMKKWQDRAEIGKSTRKPVQQSIWEVTKASLWMLDGAKKMTIAVFRIVKSRGC